MSGSLRLAPSILTADFGRLADEIRAVADVVDWFHLDVMDGHYVENLTFGPSVVGAVAAACDVPIHVHLMISEPARYARVFADAGASRLSFHPEVTEDPGEVISGIAALGVGPGLAVHPDVATDVVEPYLDALEVVLMMTVRPGFGGQSFLPEVLPKITRAAELVQANGSGADIEVDGGVNLTTVEAAVRAGGEVLVAGSAIYDGIDPSAAAARMRAKLDELSGTEA